MNPSPRNHLPLEDSWRMVEGEQDSYDTSVVPHYEDDLINLKNEPSQISAGRVSQDSYSIGGSQENSTVRDFINRADDERVILRSPFEPSVPHNVRQHRQDRRSRDAMSATSELVMPQVDTDKGQRRSSAKVSRDRLTSADDEEPPLRRRLVKTRQIGAGAGGKGGQDPGANDKHPRASQDDVSVGQKFGEAIPEAAYDALVWVFGVIRLALRYLQKPLAVLLAIFIVIGGVITVQNLLTQSLYTSLSPICRIPGAGLLGLPFCRAFIPSAGAGRTSEDGKGQTAPLTFDALMTVQDSFESVLDKTASTVTLPREFGRSRRVVESLHTSVKYSDMKDKEGLLREFSGYISAVAEAGDELITFDTKANSAVDFLILMNRLTAGELEYMAMRKKQRELSHGWVSDAVYKLFSPFRPIVNDEMILIKEYVEHTSTVAYRLGEIIERAERILKILATAEDHLGGIQTFIARTAPKLQSRRDEVFHWLLYSSSADRMEAKALKEQLALLKDANSHRVNAIEWLSEMVVDLKKMNAGLGELYMSVEGVRNGSVGVSGRSLPLETHLQVINGGISRLEQAKDRVTPIRQAKTNALDARLNQARTAGMDARLKAGK